jgi:ATP-dependent Clp protease ATP-binding subunit ClpC
MIMTSNIGADMIKGGAGFGFGKRTEATDYDNIKMVLLKEVERFFRPEFINRLDDVIVFRPLNREDLTSIIDYEVSKVSKRISVQGFRLEIDQSAKDFLIDRGYNPEYGARPLRRAISQYLEDPMSEALLSGEFTAPARLLVSRKKDAEGKDIDQLYFRQIPDEPAAPASGGESKPQAAGASST